MEQFFPFILLALAVLLLFVLPARQRKRMQEKAQAMQSSLTIGTPVMTTSGMHGSVADLSDPATVSLEIAPGVVVTFARQAILEVRTAAAVVDGSDAGAGSAGASADGPDTGTPGTTGERPADGPR